MNPWILVFVIVGATVAGDLLQSLEMKRAGEVRDFDAKGLGLYFAGLARRSLLVLAVVFMAISFFAFMKLVSFADLSFAVPATAGSLVLETILARIILKERVDARRWAGVALVALGVALLAE
jgi:drug/metabolite transporter (DMT)-like permease